MTCRPVFRRPNAALGVGLLALFVAVGGVAIGAPRGSDGVIHACFSQSDIDAGGEGGGPGSAVLRVVDAGAPCPDGAPQALKFNAQGPQGAPGPQGPAGPAGPQGKSGTPDDPTKLTVITDAEAQKLAKDLASLKGGGDKLGVDVDKLKDDLRDAIKDKGQMKPDDLAKLVLKQQQALDRMNALLQRQGEVNNQIVSGLR
jgi:hypothetical protein